MRAGAQTQRPQTGEPPDSLVTAPDASRSVYDPAITESTPFTGTEYALSAFDTVLASSVTWQRNDRPQNVKEGLATAIFNPVFQENNSNFQASLSKTNATGGTMTVSNTTFYDQTNTPTWQVPSTYAVTYQAAFNQPLMQGAGVMYNRIAGPYNPFTPSATGLNTPAFDGVMLARINVDISLADFEGGVRNLVYDVENAYWELYFSYRALEATKTGRDSALQTWEKIHALFMVGARGGEAEKEAQSKAQYYLFRGQVQTSLNDLFRSENRLRYVIGLGVADGRLMRPADEPTTAEVRFDWREVHSEAIARSVELRRQKWRIKERELEIIAAKNLLQPRLDASGQYNYYGLGDHLIGGANPVGAPGTATAGLPYPYNLVGSNAYHSLFSGQFQQYQLGLNYQMTLGFRAALSTLRYYQLNLAREKARLAGSGAGSLAPDGRCDPQHAIQLQPGSNELQPPRGDREAGGGGAGGVPSRYRHARLVARCPTAAGRRRGGLLPHADRLSARHCPSALPQGLDPGIRRRLPGRGPLAGQGSVRRPSAGPAA